MRAVLIIAMLMRVASAHRASSRTIYLNHDGVTLTPGTDDARVQTSTMVSDRVDIPAWQVSEPDWTATVACMSDMFARFDVVVTDEDPGETPHIEAVFGGSPTDMGRAANIAGLSPFASDCSTIENSIVVTFVQKLPQIPQQICEVMAQEVGHSYGLDHEMNAADPMTYLAYAGKREFQDADTACGENAARPCACSATQNTVQTLRTRLGDVGGDDIPPVLAISEPADHESVAPGFRIAVVASDNVAVAAIAIYIDGVQVATSTASTFDYTTDTAPGPHAIRVVASDANGNQTIDDLSVTADPLGCSAGGRSGLGIGLIALFPRRRRRT